jgi:hypothetical protein
MRKRSSYRPRPVYNPLVIASLKVPYVESMLAFMSALDTFTSGRATRVEWGQVRDALNLAWIIDTQVYRGGQESILEAGHQGLKACWLRFGRTGKFGFTLPELNAVRAALDVHSQQLQEVTFQQWARASTTIAGLEARAIKLAAAGGTGDWFAINMNGNKVE